MKTTQSNFILPRIYHPVELWECRLFNFWGENDSNVSKEIGKEIYKAFLSDLTLFETHLQKVLKNWTHSTEMFLSNPSLNKIAWLGQASAASYAELPAHFRGGFKLLSRREQNQADALAMAYYIKWEETVKKKIEDFINSWKVKGYPEDIPDELPERIVTSGYAPSYKAICVAILKNDHSLQSLGFSPKKSEWYKILKGIELKKKAIQGQRK